MNGAKRLAAVLAIGILVWNSRRAAAETDGDTGESLFQLGRAELAKGNVELARSYFQRSRDLDPAVGTLLNLAVCEERLGHLASATAHLREALEGAPATDRRRSLVMDRIKELERRTPRVTVRTETPLAVDVVVRLDRAPIDRRDLGRVLPIDAGPHELDCAGPRGERCTRSFTVAEGEESEQVLDIVTPTPEVRLLAPDPPDARLPSAPFTRSRAFAYGLGALGLAGVGAGLVLGTLVIERKNVVEAHCRGAICDREGLAAASSGKTLSFFSTLATGVGLGAAGTSAWLLLTMPTPTSVPSTTMVSFSGAF